MKKMFTFYTAIWIVLLALFNVIVFVVPREELQKLAERFGLDIFLLQWHFLVSLSVLGSH